MTDQTSEVDKNLANALPHLLKALEIIQSTYENIPLGIVMAAQQDKHLRELLTTIREVVPPALRKAKAS